jgi:putative copper resistance protein D
MAGGFWAIFDPENLSLFFLHTPFGPVTAVRLGLLAGVVVASGQTPRFGFMLGASALALADQAWLGHAAEGGYGGWGALTIGVYILHVGAASAWIGGLAPLRLVLREARTEARTDPRRCVEALDRFSVAGLVFVAIIVASGLGNVAFRVGWSFQILAQADYGRVLAVKSALVAAMLALAAHNRLVALPRLRAKADPRVLTLLAGGIAGECALGLGVLAVAAVLGVTPPPQ